MSSHVEHVSLRLRVPQELATDTEHIRAHVEHDLIHRVLAEVERLLHARFGVDVVIYIQHLALRWRLDALELESISLIEKLAADIAGQVIADVVALPPEQRLRPRDTPIAVLASERHADAAVLADLADGRTPAFVHIRTSPQQIWQVAVEDGPVALRELVRWLREMDRVEPAVAAAPPDAWTALEAAVPQLAAVIALVRARSSIVLTAAAHVRATPDETAAAPPASETTAVTAPEIAPQVTATPSPARAARSPDAIITPTASPVALRTESPQDLPVEQAVVHAAPQPAASVLSAPPFAGTEADTGCAGLFYLAGRVLEVELAERMWAAGLPEGDVLAIVAAAIAGDVEDVAWRWFGGAFDREITAPAVEDWAVTEVVDTVQHALGRRLVRFGITTTPAELGDRLDLLASQVVLPFAIAPSLARVVTRSVAVLATIVGARLGREPRLAELRDICRRPGRLVLDDEALHVVMSARHLDLDHRRAGLDQNPGNVPWLGRRIVLELVGGEVT